MSGKGSAPRPFSVSADDFARSFDNIFRKDAGAKDGPTIEGAKAEASSITEANGNGGQGTAQDGRQGEGNAE
jgi:hypothetical protein